MRLHGDIVASPEKAHVSSFAGLYCCDMIGPCQACSTAALNYIDVAKGVASIYSSGMPQAVELVRLNLPHKDRKVSRRICWIAGFSVVLCKLWVVLVVSVSFLQNVWKILVKNEKASIGVLSVPSALRFSGSQLIGVEPLCADCHQRRQYGRSSDW